MTSTFTSLKALLVALAMLSSAAPASAAPTSEALSTRELLLTGGVYCCTWEGCAKCRFGACDLTINTAEGVCPYKGNTIGLPIAPGEKCCHGVDCLPCDFGECLVTALLGHEGTCPFYHDPDVPKVIDPGFQCRGNDICRFGECRLVPGTDWSTCPTQGETQGSLGLGEACCLKASCTPCAPPYYCQTQAVPNFGNYPAGTCQYN